MSEEVTIRFTGGGPWDGQTILKEYSPRSFAFYENVHNKCVKREYEYDRCSPTGVLIYVLKELKNDVR